MATTKIEWTESTWNPITGCTKISSGCKFCYAEIMARRLRAMGQEKYKNGFRLTLHPETLREPYLWKKPKMIFVNSMSDLFHKDVPVDYIQNIFNVIKDNPHHVFQVLTKRADILRYYDSEGFLEWPHNLWMGVTVENADVIYRIDHLRNTGARVKFLSCEPLLTAIPDMNLQNIDWVIVGGESGRTPRPIKPEWVEQIKLQCQNHNTAFYFKQWGGTNKKKNGRLLDGKEYNEMPKPKSVV
ncbi:MAG TPA: phage Gp37/Gp68 family protein [Prolixibacteraceae bacterium]|nr:phage Gp37/Gp68 family protein [Prolixibacteraceae bacterium]HPL45408.1 phage Gp37/Gp68 family protein [Prolixibacteraceae bacterium]HQE51727.1 phage Gp37/Gp68 family protein [Prolixibacteraceae bacterium]HQH75651.1 phage Gp37/Gp68 family protein [Prolixibacteraceae bacterium]